MTTILTGLKPVRRHEYHLLSIKEVVDETAGARSLVLEVPRHLQQQFQYQAGQFLTVRLRLGFDRHIRCYSMSSSPATDSLLRITVKRVEGGLVSNWINNSLKPGYKVEAMVPAGEFVLRDAPDHRDLVMLASGSGITPVISIITTALATTGRRVRLFYANQARDAVIFAAELETLQEQHADRLEIVHHIYDEVGYVDPETVQAFVGSNTDVDVYVCGSRHFTAAAEKGLAHAGIAHDAVRYERFTSDAALEPAAPGEVDRPDRDSILASSTTESVVFVLRGEAHAVPYEKGEPLTRLARHANLTPPFACESGICGACLAHVNEGEVAMPGTFMALSKEEEDLGWVLTCQCIPVSPTVVVQYPD